MKASCRRLASDDGVTQLELMGAYDDVDLDEVPPGGSRCFRFYLSKAESRRQQDDLNDDRLQKHLPMTCFTAQGRAFRTTKVLQP